MEKIWIDIYDENDAEKFSKRWTENFKITEHNKGITISIDQDKIFRTEGNGIFWADEIKKYANNFDKRLEYAIGNLPLPHAFKEAMISIRGIIRKKKKDKINITNDYKMLYKFGVVNSMCIPYSPSLKEPGFNIFERIPGGMLFNLDIPYKIIGYKEIELFNKTDCKEFVKLWGEPEKHQTMNTFYNEIWNKYESILIEERKQSLNSYSEYFK